MIMTKKSFNNANSTLSFWESFQLETLNQKICRMVLGVHKKSSRLGTLGELGRFPLFVKALCNMLKYQAQISLIGKMVNEIKTNPSPGLNTWWGRVEKIKDNLGIKYSTFSKIDTIGNNIKKQIKSKFEIFWLNEIKKVKIGADNKNHNKLRYYSTIKGCFKKEQYLDLVPNRAQRADLSRIRISSSRLAVETMRYQRPKVAEENRYCRYCMPSGGDNNLEGYVDNEQHLLSSCGSFTLKRNCLFAKMDTIVSGFSKLSQEKQTAILLCPTSVITTKMTNKYIQILFKARKLLDEGVPTLNMGYESGVIVLNEFFDDHDNDDSDTDD